MSLFPKADERQKNRLYLTFYSRSLQRQDGVKFHTALTLTPKEPDPQQQQISCHEQDISPESCGACVLLGKIPRKVTGEEIDGILARVTVVQDNQQWRCRHWAWDAVEALVAKGLLPHLKDVSGETIWTAGYKFAAEDHNTQKEGREHRRIPVCDISGNVITSELVR